MIILIAAIGIFAVFRRLSVQNQITGTSMPANNYQAATTTTSTSSTTAPTIPGTALLKTETSGGFTYLTNTNNMTLYVFDHDVNGQSSCYGQCAVIWPPYLVPAGASLAGMPSEVGTVTRTGGANQFTWNGRPLYTYSNDKKPGDILGNGFSGIWHIVQLSSSTAL